MRYLTILFSAILFYLNCDTTTSVVLHRPYIKLTGSQTLTIINPMDFTEPGFSCVDSEDGDITDLIIVEWFHSDSITKFNEDSVKTDSIALIRYSITDSDNISFVRWRCLKFTGPFKDDLPWITLIDTTNVSVANSDFFKETGYSCLGINNKDITDSVKTAWYRKDKVTPFNPDSVKIDSAAYIKYYVTESDSLTDEKWRLVKFTGPFPQDYYDPDISTFTSCIKPNNVTQDQMDTALFSFYNYWKEEYVRESNRTTDGYYVYSGGGTGATNTAVSVSEAQGFGMVITALMGLKDSSAHKIFDGMYKFYKDHPCNANALLMAWEILVDSSGKELLSNEVGPYSNSSATDGDVDIAYGLLLAHTIWGSDGEINYLQAADTLINSAIRGYEVGEDTKRPLLGSWDPQFSYNTRPSDWMTGEFHAYAELTGETYWNDVVDTIYSVANHIINNYSPYTALAPDFVISEIPKPAPANFLEWEYDGDYYNNACRVPMRIMVDVAHYQDEFAIEWMMKVAHWITNTTDNDPENVVGGYYLLSGKEIRESKFPAFTSPFIVAATISSEYQEFVNKGWSYMVNARKNYYNDCINLLCMLQVSSNWWKPQL